MLVVTLDQAFVPQRTNSRTVMLSWVTLPWVALEKEVQGREATGADGEAGIVIIRHKICKECSTGMYSFRSSSSRCSLEFSCN